MRPGYRDEGFPVRGFNSPGQLSRVFGRVPDRNAHLDRAIAVGGDDAVEDDETLARHTAAPRGGCGEPGRGFPDPGQLTDVDVPLLGQHRLLRDVPFPDWQFRRGHPRHGYARPEAGHNLPLGGEPPFRRAPVRVSLQGFLVDHALLGDDNLSWYLSHPNVHDTPSRDSRPPTRPGSSPPLGQGQVLTPSSRTPTASPEHVYHSAKRCARQCCQFEIGKVASFNWQSCQFAFP
jgi:hypothetical protein